jgi:hypothetical protein
MKEIFEALAARIKSPIFGYFILSWVAFNWRALFYLFFSDTVIDDRFQHFDTLTSGYSLALFPILVASVVAVIYPWINYAFLYLCKKPFDLRNYLQAESEHRLLLKKKELEEARSVYLATKEKDLIDRAKRDEEVQSISDEETKEKLQKQIENLRKEIDNNEKDKYKLDRNPNFEYDLSQTYKQMADVLTKMGRLEESQESIPFLVEIQ